MDNLMPIYGKFYRSFLSKTREASQCRSLGYIVVDISYMHLNYYEMFPGFPYITCFHTQDAVWNREHYKNDPDILDLYPDHYLLICREEQETNYAAQIAFEMFQLKILELKKNNKEKVANS